jgi:hypothetical protein
MELKLGHFGQKIGNTWKVLICGAGNEYGQLFGPTERQGRTITYSRGGEGYSATKTRRKSNYIGHILCRNCLLKHVIENKTDDKVEVTERREGRRK